MSKVEKLVTAAENLSDRGDDNSHALDPEEVMIEGAEDMTAQDEAVTDETIVWEPTHSIGPYTVQERQFVNGLRYWVEENGKRRRPTANNPLRKCAPRPDPAKQMWLDKDSFSLLMTAYFAEEIERAEDMNGNVAERIDSEHVLLSIHDKRAGVDARYLISIPEEFEVVGVKLP